MADSKSEADYGDTSGSPSESEEPISQAEGGDSQIDDDEWGFYDRKPGLAVETKAGMAIIVLLVCTFSFMVYRKFDKRQQLSDFGEGETEIVADGTAAISPGESGGGAFGDDTLASNVPPVEPKPLDEELFFGDQNEPKPEPAPTTTVASAPPADTFDSFEDTPMSDDGEFAFESNDGATGLVDSSAVTDAFIDQPADDPSGFDDQGEFESFDDQTSQTVAKAAISSAVPNDDELFNDEPIGEFDTAPAEPAFDEPAFDDSPPAAAVAKVDPKPISEDFEFASQPEPAPFDEPPSTTVGSFDSKQVDDTGFFDEPEDKMLFDDTPTQPAPAHVAKAEPYVRDTTPKEAVPEFDDDWGTEPVSPDTRTTTAQPVEQFDTPLFDDESVVADTREPETFVPEPIEHRAPMARPTGTFGVDDDNVLFDDTIADTATPTTPHVRRESPPARTAEAISKFVEPGSSRVLFDDRQPSRSAQSGFQQRQVASDNSLFENSDHRMPEHRIRAEPAVMRRGVTDEYVVRRGDNYWRISKNQYGTERFYLALARLNQQRVPDPKRLRPGMKLHTPSAAFLVQRYPELFPNGIQSVSSSRTTGPSGFFLSRDGRPMYRTRRQDTLSSIAQNHLGRASRWKQIYQLNRTTLKNPNEIKDGLVLILPDDASQVRMVR